MTRTARTRLVASAGVVGLVTFSTITTAMVALAPSAAAATSSATSSAVTVTAAEQDPDLEHAPFPDLSVTVSQTTDLIAQGIRLDYSGGVKSTVPNQQTVGADFLQVFQCWGDLTDASGALVLDRAGRPQPDRTTCQYGASGLPGQSRTTPRETFGLDGVAPEDATYTHAGAGGFDQSWTAIPFRAVDGKVLQTVADGTVVSTVDLDSNEYFTRNTTNELPWAGFGASGAGTATFEVQTGAQAPGLGCGNPVTTGSVVTGRSCWLVVVPRSRDEGRTAVSTSALLWDTWQHRLAVRLDFKPLGVRCAIGAAEKALAGSELLTTAMASWQPKLCGGSEGSIFTLIVANEADQALAANGTDPAALALTTRALAAEGVTDRLTYAPVAVSGLAVGFAVDHNADPLRDVPDAVAALDAQPFTTMNLTPRLVAKLLTDSYRTSLPTGADLGHLADNPDYLWRDPDFLAVNDEAWRFQNLDAPSYLADLLVPLGRSDAAWVVWQYVLSDQDAVDFLAGKPDPWGMVVNPYSVTDAAANPTGTAATYPKDSFPKADPTSYTPAQQGEINLVTWRPYAADLDTAAYWVLRGDNRQIDPASWNNVDPVPKYSLVPRRLAGTQRTIGLTDTASAAKYQLFTAALRNPAGRFVAPSAQSMGAAAAVMSPVAGQPQVRALDFSSTAVKAAQDAYPLTVPIYAATNPAGGDAALRAAYASFIRYAAGAGQTPGTDDGQLPAGYAPLPQAWAADARTAADLIASGPKPTPTPTPTPSASPVSSPVPPAGVPAAGNPPDDGGAPPTEPTPSTDGQTPAPSGPAAGPAVGVVTPDDPDISALRAAVPVGAVGGLLAALCVPVVPRLRRAT